MPIVAALLAVAADTAIAMLAEHALGGILDTLKGDPARKAYQAALGSAIERYAVGQRLGYAQPLLSDDGLLADPEVNTELAQVLGFEREPNYALIGERWQALLSNPPQFHTFDEDARMLANFFDQELRQSDIFGPVMEAQDINQIAASTADAAESLESIEGQLEGIASLLSAGFGELVQTFNASNSSIRNEIGQYDISRLIREKTHGFVGRQWVFNAIDEFMNANARGYFFILGEPGIGKSSLSAQFVKTHGTLHHFNIRAEGINKATSFLRNICAQLIAAYGLNYHALPPETTDDAGFLNKLLNEVSEQLGPDERCLIMVDALDEADPLGTSQGANLLYLPTTLPDKVYLIVTMRPIDAIRPRIDCEQGELVLHHDSTDNLSDVADYLTASTARPGIQAYIEQQPDLEANNFVTLLVDRSEGNFMYLRYVLPEIESGAYTDLSLDDIPSGLGNYYEDHWRRMKGQDEDSWFDYKLPVLVALSVVREPVSIDLIEDFSKVSPKRQIRRVLKEWAQFLNEEEVEYEGGTQTRYRLYHASFFDFIASREEIEEERVDMTAMHGQIADTLWDDLFGEG